MRQTCTRVANTACPYRPCNGTFRFPELASNHPDALSKLVRELHALTLTLALTLSLTLTLT